jgi:MFS superfamily sulfate permease-like transporter
VIPQGIGYMPLAGLPLQYGLYASIMPGFLYCVFGTTKETTVGKYGRIL